MIGKLLYTGLILLTLGSAEGVAKTTTLKKAPVSKQIEKLRRDINSILVPSRFKSLKAGIVVASMDRNEILLEHNPNTKLIPASVNKVLTGYTALKKLGPFATFKTGVYIDGELSNGVLKGNLYLKGGGDPSLVSERMWMLTNDLLRSGVKRIEGDIIGDDSYFDPETVPESRMAYLKDEAYNAPVGALSFNFNTTTIFVRPGEKPGAKPQVFIDPHNEYIDVVNQAKTGRKGTIYGVKVSRIEHVKGDIGDTVLIRGNVPLKHPETRYYRNIVNPALYTCHMFKTFLERRGVKVVGKIAQAKTPKSARKVLDFDSIPVWHVIWGMNKFSNNFVADQILKKIGAETWGVPGNIRKGITAVQDTLEDIGIPRSEYVIADGSGLTRKSKISAKHVLQVLHRAYRDFSISPEFVSSLGVAGLDGTLRRRFPSSSRGLIRAKTGTINGVAALAGYTPTAQGELLAFAIILNDPSGKYGSLTGWVDRITILLRKFSRS